MIFGIVIDVGIVFAMVFMLLLGALSATRGIDDILDCKRPLTVMRGLFNVMIGGAILVGVLQVVRLLIWG